MSRFSGVCDLFDHIMMEKTYDKGRYLVSDELECFNIFKEKTKGVIHQHKEVEVSEYNQKFVEEHCEFFEVIPHTKIVEDKRLKNKQKEVTTYTYKYYGTEYKTLKELNKHGVYIVIDIPFDTLLDIIPYYPYVVTFCTSNNNEEVVYISEKSEVERNSCYTYGWGGSWRYYDKELQKHYLEVCKDYFLYKIDERTKTAPIKDLKPFDGNYYKMAIDGEIDYMHDVDYVWDKDESTAHWTSPSVLDKNTILLHKRDVEYYLKGDIEKGIVKIKYVESCEFPKGF